MEGQLRRSQRLRASAVYAETQQVGTNDTYGANTDTDNDTQIHGETENNGNYETIYEHSHTVDDNSANPTTTMDVLTPAATTRRYRRREVVVHDDDSTSVRSGFTTPNCSIRDGARWATRSTGVRSNNYYNVNYFRHRQSPSLTCPTACANPYTCNDCDKDRICFCRQHRLPLGCLCCRNEETKEQLPNAPCELHKTIACSINRCEETYHMGCVAAIKCIPLADLQGSGANPFICPRCEFRCTNDADVATWADASPTTKSGRVGFDYCVGVNTVSPRTKKRKLENIAAAYRSCGNNNDLLDSDPNAYPTYVSMEGEMKKKHVTLGRRFEMSLLMYNVNRCDCCGSVKPQQKDTAYPKDSLLQNNVMFSNKMYAAYHCQCNGVCNGSQFYSPSKRNQMEWYATNHNGNNPWDVNQNITEGTTNATLCESCYGEINSKNVDGEFCDLFLRD